MVSPMTGTQPRVVTSPTHGCHANGLNNQCARRGRSDADTSATVSGAAALPTAGHVSAPNPYGVCVCEHPYAPAPLEALFPPMSRATPPEAPPYLRSCFEQAFTGGLNRGLAPTHARGTNALRCSETNDGHLRLAPSAEQRDAAKIAASR